jgi:ankyrin repeat protein
MFVWFDYLSMPQPGAAHSTHTTGAHGTSAHGVTPTPTHVTTHAGSDHRHAETELSQNLTKAVRSIPAYVEHSSVMLILAPVCPHGNLDEICSFSSWRSRGWCRMELVSALLSRTDMKVMVCKGDGAVPFFQSPMDSFKLAAGKGDFACCQMGHEVNGKKIGCDKYKVKSVIEAMIDAKIEDLRASGERMSCHYFTCMKRVFLVKLPNVKKETACGEAALRERLEWTAEDDAAAETTGWSLLHCAALADDALAVKDICAKGVVHDLPLKEGVPSLNLFPLVSPLLLAMSYASFETVEALLDAGADPYYMTQGQGFAEDAAMYAAVNDNIECLQGWVKRFPDWDVNTLRPGCKTNCLSAAVYGGGAKNMPMIRALLDAGAKPMSNVFGSTPLHMAAFSDNADESLVQLFLDMGLDVNAQGDLMHLDSWKDYAFWKALLSAMELKAWSGERDPVVYQMGQMRGATPLHLAAAAGNVKICKKLLAHGADPRIKNNQGRTPLKIAELVYGTVPEALRAVLAVDEKPAPSLLQCYSCASTVSSGELIPRHEERECEL